MTLVGTVQVAPAGKEEAGTMGPPPVRPSWPDRPVNTVVIALDQAEPGPAAARTLVEAEHLGRLGWQAMPEGREEPQVCPWVAMAAWNSEEH